MRRRSIAIHYSQRFDITNNHIHDNKCQEPELAGGGVALDNVSGRIEGNVFRNNACARCGAVFVNDGTKQNRIAIERNLIDGNAGTEPESSHGGAVYLFGKTLRITGNLFTRNTVTGWGAGLYIGAYTPDWMRTSATLNWNTYTLNSAGIAGGGMFCDDGATCASFHEIYDRNCGGNIYLDSSSVGQGPTVARFDHLTNVGALDVGCKAPGPGVRIDRGEANAPDSYSFVNAIFWGNATGQDFAPAARKRAASSRST
jgi:Right handed beta helix region